MFITTHDIKKIKISKVLRTNNEGNDYQVTSIKLYKKNDRIYPSEELNIYSDYGIDDLPIEIEELKDERE